MDAENSTTGSAGAKSSHKHVLAAIRFMSRPDRSWWSAVENTRSMIKI